MILYNPISIYIEQKQKQKNKLPKIKELDMEKIGKKK